MAQKRPPPDDFTSGHLSKRATLPHTTYDSYRPSGDRRLSNSSKPSSGNSTPVIERPNHSWKPAEPSTQSRTNFNGTTSNRKQREAPILVPLLDITARLANASLHLDIADKEVQRCKKEVKGAEIYGNYPSIKELKAKALEQADATYAESQALVKELKTQQDAASKLYNDAVAAASSPREDDLITRITKSVEARILLNRDSKEEEILSLRRQLAKQGDALSSIENDFEGKLGDMRHELGNSRLDTRGQIKRTSDEFSAEIEKTYQNILARESAFAKKRDVEIFAKKDDVEESQILFRFEQEKITKDLNKRLHELESTTTASLETLRSDTARTANEMQTANDDVKTIRSAATEHQQTLNKINDDLDKIDEIQGEFTAQLSGLEDKLQGLDGDQLWLKVDQITEDVEQMKRTSTTNNHQEMDQASITLIEDRLDNLRDDFDRVNTDLNRKNTEKLRQVSDRIDQLSTTLELDSCKACKALERDVLEFFGVVEGKVDALNVQMQTLREAVEAIRAADRNITANAATHPAQGGPTTAIANGSLNDPDLQGRVEALEGVSRFLEDRYSNTTSEQMVRAMCNQFNTHYGFEAYTKQLQKLTGDLAVLRTDLGTTVSNSKSESSRISKLEGANKEIIENQTRFTAASNTSPVQQRKLAANVEALTTELSKLQSTINAQADQGAEKLRHEFDDKVKNLLKQSTDLQSSVASITRDGALKSEVKAVRNQLAILETSATELQSVKFEVVTLANRFASSERGLKDLDGLKPRVSVLETKTTGIEGKISGLDASWKLQVEGSAAKFAITETSLADLDKRLDEVKDSNDTAQANWTVVSEEQRRALKSLTSDVSAAKDSLKSTDLNLKAVQESVMNFPQIYRPELAKHQTELIKHQTDLTKHQTDLTKHQTDLTKLQTDLAAVKSAQDAVTSRATPVASRLSSVHSLPSTSGKPTPDLLVRPTSAQSKSSPRPPHSHKPSPNPPSSLHKPSPKPQHAKQPPPTLLATKKGASVKDEPGKGPRHHTTRLKLPRAPQVFEPEEAEEGESSPARETSEEL